MSELKLAMALQIDEARRLPDGVVLREFERAVRFVAAARSEWSVGRAAPGRAFEYEVPPVIEDVPSVDATPMAKLKPTPHASLELAGQVWNAGTVRAGDEHGIILEPLES